MQAFEESMEMGIIMARKMERSTNDQEPAFSPAALNILEWDEGYAQGPAWLPIQITYRNPGSNPDLGHQSISHRYSLELSTPEGHALETRI